MVKFLIKKLERALQKKAIKTMKCTLTFIIEVLGFFKAVFQQQEGNNGLWNGIPYTLGDLRVSTECN